MSQIRIGNKCISKDSKTYIVAEIGANHNGDVELAKKTIDAAVKCKVDAVKFQTYTAKELVSDLDRIVSMGPKDNIKTERIEELFERVALKREFHKEVFDYANKAGLDAYSTPFSLSDVDFLNDLNVPCFKIAASDVDYIDLLKKIAMTGKPVMLSLGKCTIGEADLAISTIEETGCCELVIMHCVSQYPSPMDEINLNTIKTLKSQYPEYIIGFSDHSIGSTAAIGAVVLGARVIEKHFTLDKYLEGPDHWFSMDPDSMSVLVKEIRNIELAMGTSRKSIAKCESIGRVNSIRSLVVNKDLKKGSVITKNDLVALRPGTGIKPYDVDKIIGMKLQKDLKANTVLTWDSFK